MILNRFFYSHEQAAAPSFPGCRAFFTDFPYVASLLCVFGIAAGSPPSLCDGDLLRPHRSPYCLRARSSGESTETCSNRQTPDFWHYGVSAGCGRLVRVQCESARAKNKVHVALWPENLNSAADWKSVSCEFLGDELQCLQTRNASNDRNLRDFQESGRGTDCGCNGLRPARAWQTLCSGDAPAF